MNRRFIEAMMAACITMMWSGCCPKKVLWKDKPKPMEPPVVVEPEDLAPPKPMPDRTGLPKPTVAKAWAPPAVNRWKMSNGMTVWHLKQSQAPLISLTVLLPNGSASDPKKKAGTTALMVDMVDEGAGGLSALQLGEAWQRLATDYSSGTAVDFAYFSLDMLADTLKPSLALLAKVLRQPTFAKTEFSRRKSQMSQAALAAEASPSTGRSHVLRTVLSNNGYAGVSPNGTKSSVGRVSLRDVKKQFKAIVQPDGAHVIVVGDVGRAALETAFEAAFGDWKGTPKPRLLPVIGTPLERGIHMVDYPGASQSAIAVARRVGAWNAKDEVSKHLMNRVLGGMFTSRLNMNLREEKGYSYGAGSAFVRRKLAGVWLAYAGVKADTTAASLKEIRGEIEGIAGGPRPITPKEFAVAKGGLVASFPGRFETFANVTNQLVPLARHGLPLDWLQRWPQRIESTTLEAASIQARKLLPKPKEIGGKTTDFWDHFVIVVAGPRQRIEASLKEFGLPIFPYDAEGKRLKRWDPPATP